MGKNLLTICSQRRARAFSFLELILVMSIISVLAVVAAPRFGVAHTRYRAAFAARQLAADLRYARSQAQASSDWRSVQFDASVPSYTLPESQALDRSDERYRIELNEINIAVSFINNTNSYTSTTEVHFDMWGQAWVGNPSAGISLAPLGQGQIVLTSDIDSQTITIMPDTGEVVGP